MQHAFTRLALQLIPAMLLSGLLLGCGGLSGAQSTVREEAGTRVAAAGNGTLVQPGAPGRASRVLQTVPVGEPPAVHTAADIAFMQGMIAHHAQALVMTAMSPDRAVSDGFKLLVERIETSQTSEIELMQDWLRSRGEDVPSSDAHHHHMMGDGQPMLMPGMLSQDQLDEVSAATGTEFERLFLTYMIGHHEGALTMVAELFAADHAAQDAAIFRFATDVETDQRMEIRRMHGMLDALGS